MKEGGELETMKIPKPIVEQIEALDRLVEEHPVYIPLPEIAKFLKANPEGIRACIESGRCPWGISWKKDIKGNKAFKIPTVTFYFWYIGAAYRQDEGRSL